MAAYTQYVGAADARVGASLFLKRYAFSLATGVLACHVMARCVPDVGADRVWVSFARGALTGAALDAAAEVARLDEPPGRAADRRAGCWPFPDEAALLEWLRERLLERHLGALIEALRGQVRLNERMLWENVAASCAWSFAYLHRQPDLRARAAAAATAFFEAPIGPLDWTGRFSVTRDPEGRERLALARGTCCLKLFLPAGRKCVECSLDAHGRGGLRALDA